MFQEYNDGDKESEKPGKNEYTVAKWIRKNVQVKKTKFLNHNVEYFSSSKALDALMVSTLESFKCHISLNLSRLRRNPSSRLATIHFSQHVSTPSTIWT